MAISLNNHEDRIKALENGGSGNGAYTIRGNGTSNPFSSAFEERRSGNISVARSSNSFTLPAGNYLFTALTNATMNGGGNGYNASLSVVLKQGSSTIANGVGGSAAEWSNLSSLLHCCVSISSSTSFSLTVGANRVSTPGTYLAILKLYYNFSYNIYSLANSISFHFFKCLINSFKGGVKEIWQLV